MDVSTNQQTHDIITDSAASENIKAQLRVSAQCALLKKRFSPMLYRVRRAQTNRAVCSAPLGASRRTGGRARRSGRLDIQVPS